MSQPSSFSPGPAPVQKQPFSVYTMMLIISFLALVTASILLYLELNRHGSYPWWNTGGGGAAPSASYQRRQPADISVASTGRLPRPMLGFKDGDPRV